MTWMQQHKGVAHSTAIRDAGYALSTVRRAVEAGRLIRVRRSWLVDPTCSPARRRAAASGGRISCITAAEELGLWTLQDERAHIAVAGSASRASGHGLVIHWAQGPIPVTSRTSDEPLVNVLFQTARCLEPADALAVWESALRQRLITDGKLARVHWRSTRAARLASVASSLSDSGLETRFVWLMRQIGVEVVQQVWIDGHPVDGLIGKRLVVQIDGFAHHSRPADRRRDISADARLVLRGYTALRFDFHQVLFQPELVQQTVQLAMAQGLHLAR